MLLADLRRRHGTQIRGRLRWYWQEARGRHETPKPSWFYPKDGWIEAEEMLRAIRTDDDMEMR